jgi:hypothetical protein
MHGMKNMSSIGAFVNAAMIRKRRVIHSITRPKTVFYSVRHDVLTQVSTGEGLRTFRLNIKAPSSWTVGPEDERGTE